MKLSYVITYDYQIVEDFFVKFNIPVKSFKFNLSWRLENVYHLQWRIFLTWCKQMSSSIRRYSVWNVEDICDCWSKAEASVFLTQVHIWNSQIFIVLNEGAQNLKLNWYYASNVKNMFDLCINSNGVGMHW